MLVPSAVRFLVPTLETSRYFKRVVLAKTECRDMPGPPYFPDVQCRIQEAQDLVAADPGDWLYIALHSDALERSCTDQWGSMHVLYPSANAVATQLAKLFCEHVVTGYAAHNGYQQGTAACLDPRPTADGNWTSMEVNPARMKGIPSMLVELGFHDSTADLTWWNDNRQGVADAFLTMLKARPGGVQTKSQS